MPLKKPVSKGYWLLLFLTASLSSLAVSFAFSFWTVLRAVLLFRAVFRIVIVWTILTRAFCCAVFATARAILIVWTLLVAVRFLGAFFFWTVDIVRALVCCIYG